MKTYKVTFQHVDNGKKLYNTFKANGIKHALLQALNYDFNDNEDILAWRIVAIEES